MRSLLRLGPTLPVRSTATKEALPTHEGAVARAYGKSPEAKQVQGRGDGHLLVEVARVNAAPGPLPVSAPAGSTSSTKQRLRRHSTYDSVSVRVALLNSL
jgi:hypothetical protein